MYNHYEDPQDRLNGLEELNDYLENALTEAKCLRLCNIVEMLQDLIGDLQMDIEEAEEAADRENRIFDAEERSAYSAAVI
jgi:hypothetical protein